jgi:hypothetical protein
MSPITCRTSITRLNPPAPPTAMLVAVSRMRSPSTSSDTTPQVAMDTTTAISFNNQRRDRDACRCGAAFVIDPNMMTPETVSKMNGAVVSTAEYRSTA